MRRTLAGALTAVALLASLGPGLMSTPASATDPFDIKRQITDEAHVLGDRQPDVQQALDRFFDRTGDRLYVVYVPSFGSATPAEWTSRTAKKSGLGPTSVLLAFATKTRASGHYTTDANLTPSGLDGVDQRQIWPALRDDDYAKATIGAAEAYGDIAEEGPLPWAWIMSGVVAASILLLLVVRRSRRRFEHTHHVLDEHGNPVDPADILTLDEISRTSAAALVAVDDALLTSASDVKRGVIQVGEEQMRPFASVVASGHSDLADAFRRRRKLDKLIAKGRTDADTERKWRKRASRILAICEQVDAALDGETAAFDRARDLRRSADGLLDALVLQVADAARRVNPGRETYALLPTRIAATVDGNVALANNLLRAATRQLEKRRDAGPIRLRAIEDALTVANDLLDAVAEADAQPTLDRGNPTREAVVWRVRATERYVASRRGAVGVTARTFRSEARRHLTAAHAATDPADVDASLSRAVKFAELGLQAATDDVAAWMAGREASDDAFSHKFDALVLAGILVDETDSGGLKTLLGGSSHGGGSGARYRGTEHGGIRTVGSFGGTTTRGRWGGF